MLVERALAPAIRDLFESYPIVTVTGPRQSGKTTLCRLLFPELPYVNLERPDLRESTARDPRGFLDRVNAGAIIDEVQRVPELLSYLQVHVDEHRRNGMFVLTGSEQFRLSESISQSLAGRTAILKLLPFSIEEAETARPGMTVDELLFTGFYPRIYDQRLNPTQALGDYFETYVERDVRVLGGVRDLSTFQRFVRLCAGRVGQLLNLQSLGNDAGVSHTTARQWISVLEASFIVFLLPPLHANLSKRLIKTPKLYFHDVGLAAWLLGIENTTQIATHPLRGSLFENLAIGEVMKYRYNTVRGNNLYFYRDSSGLEVDLIYPLGNQFLPIEIKAGQTVTSSQVEPLEKFARIFSDQGAAPLLVYGGSEDAWSGPTHALPVRSLVPHLREREAR
ncbi:MAG TPA: ATP-binding protein [Thermoanaerobaculia bacterium]